MSFPYQPFYCEENAFSLLTESPIEYHDPWMVFISNPNRHVLMFQQAAGGDESGGVVWDYHVIVLAKEQGDIWDLDTRAGFPLPVHEYLDASFGQAGLVPEPWTPLFRVLRRADAQRCFSSDRSHMLDDEGNYLHAPPDWPPIQNGPSNLLDIVSTEVVDSDAAHLQPWMPRAAFQSWASPT